VFAWLAQTSDEFVPNDVREYVTEVYRLAAVVGLNPDLLVAQGAHETDDWTSHWWKAERNPAGIGIFDDGSTQRIAYATGTDAARAQVVHMAVYALGVATYAWLELSQYKHLDPRLQAVYESGFAGSARVIGDLGSGRWATDTRYAAKIVAKANRIFGGITKGPPMTAIVFGNVPHPWFEDRSISKPAGAGQDDLGQRKVRGVVYHRILGTLRGTDTYFRRPDVNALTDYGVGVGGHDANNDDGVILRWNNPRGRQSGWASGPVNGAYGDGAAFVNKYGVNAVNRDQASIEISGNYDTPLTPRAIDAIVNLTAYWADQANIPWDQFPIVPGDGFSFVRFHQEFTLGSGKVCPGQVVMDATADLIERTRAVLKTAQTVAVMDTTAEYAVPLPITWSNGETGWKRLNGHPVFAGIFAVEVVRNTVPKAHAGDGAEAAGPKLKQGETVKVVGSFQSGKSRWLIRDVDHARISGNACRPLLPVKQ